MLLVLLLLLVLVLVSVVVAMQGRKDCWPRARKSRVVVPRVK